MTRAVQAVAVPGLVGLSLLGALTAGAAAWQERSAAVGLWPVLLAFCLVAATGEIFRQDLRELSLAAPITTATGLGLVLSADLPEPGGMVGSAGLVGSTVVLAVILGSAGRRTLGLGVDLGDVATRLVPLLAATFVYRRLTVGDATLVSAQAAAVDERWTSAAVMVVVTALTAALELVLLALVAAARANAPLRTTARDRLMTGLLPLTALAATGALIALGERVMGLAALPLFTVPLLVTQAAALRFAEIRRTYDQTLRALSMLPEVTGFSRPGHGARVADLAVRMGTDLGLPQRELRDLEDAALLHDLGLVALAEPIPEGRTVVATPGDQQIIADEGVHIVRQAGVLDAALPAMTSHATPFRVMRELGEPIPLAGRILRVANAYDDFADDPTSGHSREQALERLHLGLGYEYDPAVVECLARVVRRQHGAGAAAGAPG